MLSELDAYLAEHPEPDVVYGIFAFATASGVAMLRETQVWGHFSSASDRQLVIGFDAITNTSALVKLREAAQGLGPGSIMAINPAHPAQLAHAKFILLGSEDRLTVCVASNNLTGPALESTGTQVNGEAYSFTTLLDGEARNESLQEYHGFVGSWAPYLVDISDQVVNAWAAENDRRQQAAVTRSSPRDAKNILASTGSVSVPGKDLCLVMRTPSERGDTQIGVTARVARRYFGTTHANVEVDYVPQPLGDANTSPQGPVRVTLGGPRAGGNIGMELNGVARALSENNETFDPTARPIVVMREAAPSYYRYTVLLPGTHGDLHRRLDTWLSDPQTNADRRSSPHGTDLLRAVVPAPAVADRFPPATFPLD